MRRNRAAEDALRTATAKSDVFEDAAIMHAPRSGRKSLQAFADAGWVEKIEPITMHRQKYRITDQGRRALQILSAELPDGTP